MTRQPAPQRALDVIDLTDAVELIPRQVQQHDHRGIEGVGHMRHVHLVDFQCGQRRIPRPRQCGHQPGVHVRALGVGGDGPQRAERRRGHPGGGRLAVGAGHDRRATALAELAQDRFVERHRDQAADHRACAAAR